MTEVSKKINKPKKKFDREDKIKKIHDKSQKLIASGKSIDDVIQAIALDVAYSKSPRKKEELEFKSSRKKNFDNKDKNSRFKDRSSPKSSVHRIKSDLQRKLEIIQNADKETNQ